MVFLVRKGAVPFKVDTQKLLTSIALLKEQPLTAKFVGPEPNLQVFEIWLQTLKQGSSGFFISFIDMLGRATSFCLAK